MSELSFVRVNELHSKPTGGRQMIAVTSTKGGIGKTTTAINVAFTLLHKGRTVLVDLNTPHGNVATRLLLFDPPITTETWESKRFSSPNLTDGQVLNELVIRHQSGLYLVPAGQMSIDTVGIMLTTLAHIFDFVVLDVSSNRHDVLTAALTTANRVFLVLDYDLATIKDTQDYVTSWDRQHIMLDKVVAVMNFEPIQKDSNNIHRGNIEDYLPSMIKVVGHLPEVSGMRAIQNSGKVLAQDEPDHPFSAEIRKILSLFVPDMESVKEQKGFHFGKFFSRKRN